MRKIKQISVSGVDNNFSTQCNYVVVSLCDDGTVWQLDDGHPKWVILPNIPQDELEETVENG